MFGFSGIQDSPHAIDGAWKQATNVEDDSKHEESRRQDWPNRNLLLFLIE
jgi:hypothetical protein